MILTIINITQPLMPINIRYWLKHHVEYRLHAKLAWNINWRCAILLQFSKNIGHHSKLKDTLSCVSIFFTIYSCLRIKVFFLFFILYWEIKLTGFFFKFKYYTNFSVKLYFTYIQANYKSFWICFFFKFLILKLLFFLMKIIFFFF